MSVNCILELRVFPLRFHWLVLLCHWVWLLPNLFSMLHQLWQRFALCHATLPALVLGMFPFGSFSSFFNHTCRSVFVFAFGFGAVRALSCPKAQTSTISAQSVKLEDPGNLRTIHSENFRSARKNECAELDSLTCSFWWFWIFQIFAMRPCSSLEQFQVNISNTMTLISRVLWNSGNPCMVIIQKFGGNGKATVFIVCCVLCAVYGV